MKKLLLFIFIALQICSGKAQVVFCPPGSVWQSIFTSGYPNQTIENETVTYIGKQFISPDTVKVLNHLRFFLWWDYYSFISSTYIKQSGDTIFMKNWRTKNTWQILYNYAAQIGDSWYDSLYFGAQTHPAIINYTITVLSTQTVTINGQNLKQLTVQQKNNWPFLPNNIIYKITERLGSDMFLFTFEGRSSEDDGFFVENLCHTDNTFGTYHYSNKSCDYSEVGIIKNTLNSASLSLCPNPTTADLNLNLENQNTLNNKYTFCITNSLGEKIKEGGINFEDKETRINVQSFAEGIYFLSLRSSENGDTEIINKCFVRVN